MGFGGADRTGRPCSRRRERDLFLLLTLGGWPVSGRILRWCPGPAVCDGDSPAPPRRRSMGMWRVQPAELDLVQPAYGPRPKR
jgi:hypothetical protein